MINFCTHYVEEFLYLYMIFYLDFLFDMSKLLYIFYVKSILNTTSLLAKYGTCRYKLHEWIVIECKTACADTSDLYG